MSVTLSSVTFEVHCLANAIEGSWGNLKNNNLLAKGRKTPKSRDNNPKGNKDV